MVAPILARRLSGRMSHLTFGVMKWLKSRDCVVSAPLLRGCLVATMMEREAADRLLFGVRTKPMSSPTADYWRRVTSEVFASEFKDIELQHQLADSMAMLMVRDPKRFNGVIHTDNTFGDILSDISGGIIGTLGVLPSASVCGVPGEGVCNGIYEPVHGSAPDIAGKGLVNPVAQILSLAMLLRYSLGLLKEASAIEKAVAQVMDSKEVGGLEIRTSDLGGEATTGDVGDAVCEVLCSIL